MARFRKRPLIVNAEQWFPGRDIEGVLRIPANKVDLSKTRGIIIDRPQRYVINTMEGQMDVCIGDWIVTGVFGEKYPVHPEIFEATYEPVKEKRYDDITTAKKSAENPQGDSGDGRRAKRWFDRLLRR